MESVDSALAFNQGSDARLAGLPRIENPYLHDSNGWRYWRMGWQDVDRHWCESVHATYTPLPPVEDESARLSEALALSSELDRWIRGGEEE
jgi:hypothetical protein